MMKRVLPYALAVWIFCLILLPAPAVFAGSSTPPDRPWTQMKKRPSGTDHSSLFKEESFADGPSVTRACLKCHPETARDFMTGSHWTWLGDEQVFPGRDRPMRVGKKNLINNFCISIEGNWPKCTSCHAGYGWKDANFDFNREENVDCLICHDQSGQYAKGTSGLPAEGVDLLAAARSVGTPTRDNCGWCHFNGGGGNAVKHGDLDGSLAKPVERIDVHMGRHDFQCVDCHRTVKHRIGGRMIATGATNVPEVNCTDCHSPAPHRVERLNEHTGALSCQTCHIPRVALREPTKVAWDWSTAGHDVDVDDPHQYLKIKGSFLYARDLLPWYRWYNGNAARYLKGDKIDPDGVTPINDPQGSISDPRARIRPFKVHRGKQPYDEEYDHLLVVKTVGEGGYWTEFDWDKAARLGAEASGVPYSGKMGFAETDMYWSLNHMVAPREGALQCTDCHGQGSRMDWKALGYGEDPAFTGGRGHRRLVPESKGDGS